MITPVPRIMVDLETLSSRGNAVVVSIGAVEFGPSGTGREFYEVLTRADQVGYGRHVDPNTVDWWLEQSPEARAVFKDNRAVEPELALARFHAFCLTVAGSLEAAGANLQVWGYGSTFDNVVLRSLYQDLGIKAPWGYRGDMCYRTLVNLAKGLVEVPPRTGTHHNALDDARYQAQCAAIYLKRLGVPA